MLRACDTLALRMTTVRVVDTSRTDASANVHVVPAVVVTPPVTSVKSTISSIYGDSDPALQPECDLEDCRIRQHGTIDSKGLYTAPKTMDFPRYGKPAFQTQVLQTQRRLPLLQERDCYYTVMR